MSLDLAPSANHKKFFLQNFRILFLCTGLLVGCHSFQEVSVVSHGDEEEAESSISAPASHPSVNPQSLPSQKIERSFPVTPKAEKLRDEKPPAVSAILAQPSDDSTLPWTLEDVFFDYDQMLIRKDDISKLQLNAKVLLKRYPGREVVVQGHCDERGTEEYNLILGERRAMAVKLFLVDLGVPASSLHVLSLGKSQPFCLDPIPKCFQQNRRAHFVLK